MRTCMHNAHFSEFRIDQNITTDLHIVLNTKTHSHMHTIRSLARTHARTHVLKCSYNGTTYIWNEVG